MILTSGAPNPGQNRIQDFMKANQMTTLEKIEEKNPRSSSQGAYTNSGKYQSTKTKLTQFSSQVTKLPDAL